MVVTADWRWFFVSLQNTIGVFWVSAAGVPALARQIRVSGFRALPAHGRAMLLRPAVVVFQPPRLEAQKRRVQGICMHGAAWVAWPAQRAAQLPCRDRAMTLRLAR